jgi:D-serine deaminase-like pyridoxal phosphate-dependent protein
MPNWFEITNPEDVASPALLIYPDRVEENIGRMIAMAGGVERLRPHMKTNKLPEIIRMQMARGITKFKCATIAEAEMTASCGAPDVFLAYQPVGPNARRMVELIRAFPATRFSTIADDAETIRNLSGAAVAAGFGGKAKVNQSNAAAELGFGTEVLLDIDCGMHRCGVEPGPRAVELYRLIASLPGLTPGGLHAYDGHLNDTDLQTRARKCDEAFAPVIALRRELVNAGLAVPRIVAGGTPTFPIHARRAEVECSPGTCVFWDFGYAEKLPDLDFLPAALVLTRVVSKPGSNRLCLDLGHKAIASENPHPRVKFLNLPEAQAVIHSEEHLVLETPRAGEFAVGDCLYGVPRHICPTVALHSQAVTIEKGKATQWWKVAGRERKLTI